MKNVTLAMDEALLEKARALAEKRKTSLNALIRSLLQHEVEQDDRIAWAREGMRRLMEESPLEFEPGTDVKELSRRDTRGELHGYEHPDLGGGRKAG